MISFVSERKWPAFIVDQLFILKSNGVRRVASNKSVWRKLKITGTRTRFREIISRSFCEYSRSVGAECVIYVNTLARHRLYEWLRQHLRLLLSEINIWTSLLNVCLFTHLCFVFCAIWRIKTFSYLVKTFSFAVSH